MALNYPREILKNIFEESNWNLELRKLNRYFFGFYDRFYNFKFIITSQDELDIVRIKFKNLSFLIEVKRFIPNNLDRIISIDNNFIDGIIALSEMLNVNKTLTSLNLSRNYHRIGDEGIINLARSLEENKTLKYLDLSGMKINDRQMNILSEMLEINETITIKIGNNLFDPYRYYHLLDDGRIIS